MSKKLRKRNKAKKAFQSAMYLVQNLCSKVVALAKSRIVRRIVSLYALTSIFSPGPSYAITIDNVNGDSIFEYGKNVSVLRSITQV